MKDVRDLRGVLDREKAAIGILISLQPPTSPMETEAASACFYEHKTNQQKFPRLQLRTVKELMEGKGIERPSTVAATDEPSRKPRNQRKSTANNRHWNCETSKVIVLVGINRIIFRDLFKIPVHRSGVSADRRISSAN